MRSNSSRKKRTQRMTVMIIIPADRRFKPLSMVAGFVTVMRNIVQCYLTHPFECLWSKKKSDSGRAIPELRVTALDQLVSIRISSSVVLIRTYLKLKFKIQGFICHMQLS